MQSVMTNQALCAIALFMARSGRGRQLTFEFPAGWGGARKKAGRKAGPRPSTPHRARPFHRASDPVHVTLRSRFTELRSQFVFPTVRLALLGVARRNPESFRIAHFSVQRDHVHLVVEAADKRALSSGVRSVVIRIARYVNDLLKRRGPLWADRWHGRALRSPREVRNTIVYVLANFRKHARRPLRAGLDPYSSAEHFDGWDEWRRNTGVPPPFVEPVRTPPVANTVEAREIAAGDFVARTWLATIGWRRHGLIGLAEAPAG